MISVNTLINNCFKRTSLIGDDEVANGSQAENALNDLHSLISELNTENCLSSATKSVDVITAGKIKFAIKPEGWFELPSMQELEDKISANLVNAGEIYKINKNFFTIVYNNNQFVIYTNSEFQHEMEQWWANVWIDENIDRVMSVARKLGNRFIELLPSNKTKIDSYLRTHLPTQYYCQTIYHKINYPHNIGIDPEYELEYFEIEVDSNMPIEYRINYFSQIPKFNIEDTLKINSKYENLLEEGLCVKLCQRYKQLEILPMFEAEFEKAKRAIRTINLSNSEMVYDFANDNIGWDRNYINFAGRCIFRIKLYGKYSIFICRWHR